MKRPGSLVLSFVCLSASLTAASGCKPVDECETVELGETELLEFELRPADIIGEFDAAPTPTLTWLDPPLLEEGWGLEHEPLVSHVGVCTTLLHLELELRDDAPPTYAPRDPQLCGWYDLTIPVDLALVTEDGVLAAAARTRLVLGDTGPSLRTFIELPTSLQLQVAPAPASHQLVLEAQLVDGQLSGALRLHSHDCNEGGACSFALTHLLATFGPQHQAPHSG